MTGSQCILPAELVIEILCYTSSLDVVRWRTVSKWFCTLTHDPTVWKALYVNAPFLRPRGPCPTVAFEDAFAKSERLEKSWTTEELRTGSRVRIPFEGRVTKHRHLVGGRWLVVCQADRRFVLYDTHVHAHTQKHKPQVIWEQADKIVAWDKCLATSEQEQIVYVLMSMDNPPRLRLLEMRLNAESGAVCDTVTWDIPVSEVDEDPELDNGQTLFARSRFISIPHQSLIFDTRTRTFYEFPEFRIALDKSRTRFGARKFDDVQIVPTNTHIIVYHDYYERFSHRDSVIQVFTLPDDQRPAENGKRVLRLTHEGFFPSRDAIFAIMRNTAVDTTTGTTTITYLERHPKYGSFRSICINLILEKPSPDNVLPARIKWHHLLLQGEVHADDDLMFCNAYYDTTDDGYARGLFTRNHECTQNSRYGVMKFTIDATGDHCVATCSRFSRREQWDDIVSPIEHHKEDAEERLVLDGVRGKLVYIDTDSENEDTVNGAIENGAVVVVDIE
ncbi:hypothetical protein EV363DRAFT_1589108 [Boletus edulis]|nr:hypothetical protein EV363DRAFT_1589108 [Boletus edulis]